MSSHEIFPGLEAAIRDNIEVFEAAAQAVCAKTSFQESDIFWSEVSSSGTVRLLFAGARASLAVHNGREGYLVFHLDAGHAPHAALRPRGWITSDSPRNSTFHPPARVCAGCPNLMACTLEGIVAT